MGKMSPKAEWEKVSKEWDALGFQSEQYGLVYAKFQNIDHVTGGSLYNHDILRMALDHVLERAFSMADAADEYERYERAEEIMDSLS
jgi:hypothetical protein